MDNSPTDNLYMRGLPPGTDEESLRSMFASVGTVVQVKILPTAPGMETAAALVRMSSVEEAMHLVENSAQFAAGLGAPLAIMYAQSGRQKGGGKGCGGAPYGGPGGAMAPPPPPAAVMGGAAPGTRLYVKGLPFGITEEQVRQIFSGYGNVLSCKVLPPPAQGANDTAAIVQMSTTQEAQWLVDNVNGNIPQGLPGPVEVKFKTERGEMGGGYGAPPMAQMAAVPQGPVAAAVPSENIFIKGLPAGLTEQGVAMILGSYGTVAACTIVQNPDGTNDTACYVRMSSFPEAQFLVDNLNGNIPHGLNSPVSVSYADGASLAAAISGAGGGGGGSGPTVVPSNEPSENLFMKGFPEGMTAEALAAIFSAYGKVLSAQVMPPDVGIVRMGSVAEAQWLVTNVNGNIPQGLTTPIQVSFAQQSAPPPQAAPKAAGGWPAKDNLYVKGFPADINEPTFRGIMGQYGTVRACIILPPPPGLLAAAAIVRYGTPQEAQWVADNLNGNIPSGMATPIEVKFASNMYIGGGAKGGGKGKDGYAPY